MFVKLAVLNLLKHRKRTLLLLFAIFTSVLVMEVVAGMFHGIEVNFFRNLTQEGGHVQLHAAGWEDRLNPYSLDYMISDYSPLIQQLKNLPDAEAVEPVLHFGAMLQHNERSVNISGTGVRADTAFYRNVREGITAGTFLQNQPGILISTEIASLLQAETGDNLIVVVQDSTGSPFYAAYPVLGLFTTPSPEFDESTFFLHHSETMDLLYLPDQTSEVRVRLSHPERADAFQTAAAKLTDSEQYEIHTWRNLHQGMTSMIELMDFFILVMNIMVITVAASVITNAILMNVFERTAEFGTMRAIGVKRRTIARIILTEGAITGIIGSLLGLTGGIPIVLYFTSNGIDMGGMAEAFGMGTSHFYFGYSPISSLMSLLGGVLIAAGGSLYAAQAGSRLSIMEALRYE